MNLSKALLLAFSTIALATACSGARTKNEPPIKPVAQVDLQRFMGPWHVIAAVPSFVENKAFNAVETYTLEPNGHIDTSFRYRNSSFDNPVKKIHSIGFVQPNTNNAVWGVQIVWPIKAQYIIAYLNDDYSETIIARDKRDYVWIMARTPTIPQADYDALVERVRQMGYKMSDLRKVPQQWPEKSK
jgi:apolipoprotein D and lipocalin family protein